jgi:hypothetical protein
MPSAMFGNCDSFVGGVAIGCGCANMIGSELKDVSIQPVDHSKLLQLVGKGEILKARAGPARKPEEHLCHCENP